MINYNEIVGRYSSNQTYNFFQQKKLKMQPDLLLKPIDTDTMAVLSMNYSIYTHYQQEKHTSCQFLTHFVIHVPYLSNYNNKELYFEEKKP